MGALNTGLYGCLPYLQCKEKRIDNSAYADITQYIAILLTLTEDIPIGLLSANLEPFTRSLEHQEARLEAQRPIDKKTDELLHFALSIKARSNPALPENTVSPV